MESAAHWHALDDINDEISPVCPAQRIEGAINGDVPRMPSRPVNKESRVGDKQVRVSRMMWVEKFTKLNIPARL